MRLEISSFKRIVVLTGAGISAESGVSTFRDSGGLWEQHRIEDVATPEAFERDPVLVWKFYSMRRRAAFRVAPNKAHTTLARFAATSRHSGVDFTLITQNVDMLHERAHASEGAAPPIAMHGTLSQSRCSRCFMIYEDHNIWLDESGPTKTSGLEMTRDKHGLPLTPCCRKLLRPHIVWFGEVPLQMETILEKLSSCDLFVTIGTSGLVYPAAGFLEQAKFAGAVTACLNMEHLPQQRVVDFYFEGAATQTVPRLFAP